MCWGGGGEKRTIPKTATVLGRLTPYARSIGPYEQSVLNLPKPNITQM